MSLPIILANSGVDWKGDALGTGYVGILDSSGNPIRKTQRLSAHEMGINNYDVSDLVGVVLDITPAAESEYTTTPMNMTVDGYDVASFMIHGSGSGSAAFQIHVEGSMNGSHWHPVHSFYCLAPQNGAEKGGMIEWRSCFKYVRLRITTESAAAGVPTNINVTGVRSLKSVGGSSHAPGILTNGPAFDEAVPHSRGLYVTEYVLAGVATANYVYIALKNPPTAPSTVQLVSAYVTHQNVANQDITTLRSLNMVAISTISGGTEVSPPPFRSGQPPPFARAYSGNPTVTQHGTIFSFSMAPASFGTVSQNTDFRDGLEPLLRPGEGWALIPSVTLSTTDRISLRAVFREIV